MLEAIRLGRDASVLAASPQDPQSQVSPSQKIHLTPREYIRWINR